MRKWRFRTCVVNQLSQECKQQVTQLMEPDAKSRPSAANFFQGPWIAMDPRLTSTLFFTNVYVYEYELLCLKKYDSRESFH